MNLKFKLSLPLFFLILFSGCGGSSSSPDVLDVTDSPIVNWQPKSSSIWEVGDAAQENFNTALIDSTYSNAKQTNVLKNLLIIRNNKLIAEAYFDGTNANTLMQERSVTKTIIAVLIGIAIENGYLSGIEQTIGEFFEDDYSGLSENKKNITIENLLTMSSGFQWDESQYNNWASSSDPQGYLLNRGLVDTPGENFLYNSAGAHLLSVILTKATGMSSLQFANEKLFLPLGITEIRWEKLNDNFYNGGAGIELRPVDLAKIGLMLLNNGDWEMQSIVPSAWVVQAKDHQLNLTPGGGTFKVDGYGYLIWLGTGNNQQIQLAWGWGGQYIALIPEKNMVVIMNSDSRVNRATAESQYDVSLDILVNQIIPAAN